MKRSAGHGVDILEWKKARAFFKRHHDRLARLFSVQEKRFILKAADPQEAFAKMFSAKEAAAKAASYPLFSPDDFKKFKVHKRSDGELYATTPGKFKRRLAVRFSRTKEHLVACCYPLRGR